MKHGVQKAFTLIELIIVVSIITIILGISLAKYNDFTEKKKLDQDADKLVDVLETARKKAMAGDLSGKTCPDFQGYRVDVSASSSVLNLCCKRGCTTSFQLSTYTLQGTNSVTLPNKNIWFVPLTGQQLGGAGDQIINIKNKIIKKCMDINISQEGVIEEADSQISC